MSLASGHTAKRLEGEERERILNKFPASKESGFVRFIPDRWFFPTPFTKYANKMYNFKVKPTDVYVMTYSKVGTTWTQEIVWTMKYNPNLDHPDSGERIKDRSPFMEGDMFEPDEKDFELTEEMKQFMKGFFKYCPNGNPMDGLNWQVAEAIPDPRVLKTHLAFSLLPPDLLDTAKVIYVARNPRDVVCSYYHHCKIFNEMKFTGTLDEFCEHFINDECIYSPYDLHVKEAWEKRYHPNMHFMLFEDMKADIMKELWKLNDFLGTNLTEKQLENVKNHTSFNEMKKRDTITDLNKLKTATFLDTDYVKEHGGFFRQGTAGEGKKRLGPEMSAKMDVYIKDRFNFGLNFE